MIRGHKPSGYTLTFDREGRRIEAETRQCVHCQFSWGYGEPHCPEEMDAVLGHPTRRGWCVKCNGWLCGRRDCIAQQLKLVEAMRLRGRTVSCIPFEEWANRLQDKFGAKPLDPELTVTESGVIVPRRSL